MPILYVSLIFTSILKLRKFEEFDLRSFVNLNRDVLMEKKRTVEKYELYSKTDVFCMVTTSLVSYKYNQIPKLFQL
jgi:hypothetical protein